MTQAVRGPKVMCEEIRVTTTGAGGSATGNTTSKQIVGQILGIEVDWHADAPAGTSDITIEGATTGIDLNAKANSVTDKYVVPGVYGLDAGAAALTGDVTPQKLCIAEGIKVTVAQSDALTDCVIVRVIYRPVRCEVITVTTTGSAGSASGEATGNPIVGEVLGLAIDYGQAAGTTDITIEGATTGLDLYAKSNSVTDAFVVPVIFSLDAAGSALSNDVTPRRYCIGEAVKVTLAQANAAAAAVTVRVFYDPDIQAETIAVTTTGADGSASGEATGLLTHGEILGLAVNYHGSTPATANLVVESALSGINFYAKEDSATDAYVAPGLYAVTAAEGSLASNVTPERYVIGSPVKVSLIEGNALTDAVRVTVFSRR